MPRGLGVAVRSAPIRILESLQKADRDIVVRQVRYDRPEGEPLGDDPVDLLGHKRPEFAHERELRFIATIRPDELAAIESLEHSLKTLEMRHASSRGRPVILTGKGYASDDKTIDRRTSPGGVHLPTNLAALIEEVRLGPGVAFPVRRAVIDATEVFGLDRRLVREGPMHHPPPDETTFHD
jgi:hypothetical protein